MENNNLVTLVFVADREADFLLGESYYKNLFDYFERSALVVRQGNELPSLCKKHDIIVYERFEDKVDGINRAAGKVHTPWLLILESDEKLRTKDLPDLSLYEPNCCFASQIESAGVTGYQINYHIRLIPNSESGISLFEGVRICDISKTCKNKEWRLADYFIPVQKKRALFQVDDIKAEALSETSCYMQDYWRGIWYLENKKYNAAENCFRNIVKENRLFFDFYALSALNNLVITLFEQHHFDESKKVARQSLNKNPRQYTPHLILHKINELKGHFEESYENLQSYLEVSSFGESEATLDLTLPMGECHYLMAEISHKMGNFKRALNHYEQFYNLNAGEVSPSVLEKLFLYSIELQNYDKSAKYFYEIFGQFIPDKLTDEVSARMLEALSLFMDNGWFEFVSDIYEQLVLQYPDNNNLLNKWISSLIKNNNFEKAQSVISRRTG